MSRYCSGVYLRGKIKAFIFLLGIIILPLGLHAQEIPCDGSQDPTGSSTVCPIDDGVWMLVLIAVAMGSIFLRRMNNVEVRR